MKVGLEAEGKLFPWISISYWPYKSPRLSPKSIVARVWEVMSGTHPAPPSCRGWRQVNSKVGGGEGGVGGFSPAKGEKWEDRSHVCVSVGGFDRNRMRGALFFWCVWQKVTPHVSRLLRPVHLLGPTPLAVSSITWLCQSDTSRLGLMECFCLWRQHERARYARGSVTGSQNKPAMNMQVLFTNIQGGKNAWSWWNWK